MPLQEEFPDITTVKALLYKVYHSNNTFRVLCFFFLSFQAVRLIGQHSAECHKVFVTCQVFNDGFAYTLRLPSNLIA